MNEKIDLLSDLREKIKILNYGDSHSLDEIRRKGEMLIRNFYGDESHYLSDLNNISFYPMVAPCSEDFKQKRWQDDQQEMINLVSTMIEEATLFGDKPNVLQNEETTTDSISRVFIVHGHEDSIKNSVARFVEKLGLKAIILHEQANEGRTIIEKFEKHACNSGFAIVLCTPDDVGYPKDHQKDACARARQNVILELGFFCGSLGRNRVCVLHAEGIEIPTDYLGVIYIPLDQAATWQLQLAKELKTAGLNIDMNKVFD